MPRDPFNGVDGNVASALANLAAAERSAVINERGPADHSLITPPYRSSAIILYSLAR